MTSRFQLVPAAYVFLQRGAQVLLQLRADTGYMDGYWAAAAAGHVEADESVYDAAAREAHEELGVRIEKSDLVPLCGMHRTADDHQWVDERVDFFFACRRWYGEPTLLEAKATDLQWFALDRLPDPVVPHERAVLDGIRAGRLSPIVTFGF
ncbi:MAG: NUDIX domain-containing protein [Nocardioidaceae bacterium]